LLASLPQLKEQGLGEPNSEPLTMAILNADPDLTIHDAYHLANQFGCDENMDCLNDSGNHS